MRLAVIGIYYHTPPFRRLQNRIVENPIADFRAFWRLKCIKIHPKRSHNIISALQTVRKPSKSTSKRVKLSKFGTQIRFCKRIHFFFIFLIFLFLFLVQTVHNRLHSYESMTFVTLLYRKSWTKATIVRSLAFQQGCEFWEISVLSRELNQKLLKYV